ncbi:hypothetical protein EV421DRAFT_1344406 [Armillaria borealis]|uniref:Uncharacterized protein n=1 Tax=Armillaria borealis TaxID=47425 RepID=A0AA39MHR9_9AGAR|nr:hypothetical protein EV421DRAFT_1344406 [Armillaria borealis]
MAKPFPVKTTKETLHQSSVSKYFSWSSHLPSVPVFVFKCGLCIFKWTCRFFSVPVLSVFFITTNDAMMVLANRRTSYALMSIWSFDKSFRHVIVHLHLFLVVFSEATVLSGSLSFLGRNSLPIP